MPLQWRRTVHRIRCHPQIPVVSREHWTGKFCAKFSSREWAVTLPALEKLLADWSDESDKSDESDRSDRSDHSSDEPDQLSNETGDFPLEDES